VLPDTIKLDKLFYVNIMKYYDTYLKDKEIYSLPFINPSIRPTMDMGILNIKHIYRIFSFLRNMINKKRNSDLIFNNNNDK
jgi:hypothetical protein